MFRAQRPPVAPRVLQRVYTSCGDHGAHVRLLPRFHDECQTRGEEAPTGRARERCVKRAREEVRRLPLDVVGNEMKQNVLQKPRQFLVKRNMIDVLTLPHLIRDKSASATEVVLDMSVVAPRQPSIQVA